MSGPWSSPVPVVSADYSPPPTLRALRDIRVSSKASVEWWKFWEFLRPFFKQHGYVLYKTAASHFCMAYPLDEVPPAIDSFNLYGDRSKFMRCFPPNSTVLGARDQKNRDVAVKVVAKGDEGNNELKILQMLQSEPLKSDPQNATIEVLEYLYYEDWVIVVMPAVDQCDEHPFVTVDERLDFGEQLFAALAFLHANCIAHLDVAVENTVMNHAGTVREEDEDNFRSSFPVRYSLIDFGRSEHAPLNGPGSGYLRRPLHDGRPSAAPESTTRRFDPYAADVWQASRVLYSTVYELIDEIPGLLELLQDMNRWLPRCRPTMAESARRLRDVRAAMRTTHPEASHQLRDFMHIQLRVVPLRHWTTAIDGLRMLDFKFVFQFVVHFRKELFTSALKSVRRLLFGAESEQRLMLKASQGKGEGGCSSRLAPSDAISPDGL